MSAPITADRAEAVFALSAAVAAEEARLDRLRLEAAMTARLVELAERALELARFAYGREMEAVRREVEAPADAELTVRRNGAGVEVAW